MRLILRDDIDIAQPLLTDATLTDSDLLDCIRHATGAHRQLIAQRRGLSEVVSEALVEAGETLVVEALLRNDQARLSPCAVETRGRHDPAAAASWCRCCCGGPRLRPNHAYMLFWWAETDAADRSSSASRSRARCCRRRPATSSRWPPQRTGRTT